MPKPSPFKSPLSRADEFLDLVQRSKRGRLKVYIGFAAGVGKTFQMLHESQALRRRGVDVVLGYIETHGRQETAALVRDLEVVPRKSAEYRGVVVEEMDLEAILRRAPQVVVVDEIAHTNAPFCRNKKRYKDVLDLIAAGVNVIGALNVQHLESLNELVERTTGVSVRETVPDAFIKAADQVVNIDLAVEDLQERLRAGKIYSDEKVPWALSNFFKDDNLTTLRELALREVAESLEHTKRPLEASRMRRGRVLVCMSSYPPYAMRLLYRGSRMAGRLDTDWFVVYVETPQESPERIDAEAQRHLLVNMEKARELGAEFVRLQGTDPVDAIIDFARAHHVAHIIVGRSHQSWWKQVLGRSMPLRLVQESAGFDLHIVSLEPADEPADEPYRGME